MKCAKCGYEWKSRLKVIMKPKACPRCKRYDWQEKTAKSNERTYKELLTPKRHPRITPPHQRGKNRVWNTSKELGRS